LARLPNTRRAHTGLEVSQADAELNHPNTETASAFYFKSGVGFFVMELIRRQPRAMSTQSLQTKAAPSLPQRMCCRLARQSDSRARASSRIRKNHVE